jgi:protein TonB
MALLQRAQPLPAPPHTISGAVLDLTVPIEFELR